MKALLVTLLLAGCASTSGGGPDAAAADDDGGALPDAALAVDAAVVPSGDGLPTGAVSYFRAAACPTGWQPYTQGAGRVLMPLPDADGGVAGPVSQGAALGSGEDRAHAHSVTATMNLPNVQYVGVAGSGNGGLAPSGAAPVVATLSQEQAALPYIQLLVCEKTAAPLPAAHPVPPGTRLFFTAICPAGWTRAAESKGRYLVGLPNGGAAGAFGGPALGLGEQRTHTHTVMGTVMTAGHGIALASGCCGSGYAQNGSYSFAVDSSPASAAPPYLQLAQCQKD